MATYGLSDSGFLKKTQSVIQSDMFDDLDALYTEPVNRDAASISGQLVGVLSNPIAELWEQAEKLFTSFNPNSATGVPLDGIGQFTGAIRLPATKSTVQLGMEGTAGTTVPAGSQFRVPNTSRIFESTADAEITLDSVIKATLKVDGATVDSYNTIINGVTYDYQAQGGDTVSDIVTGIYNALTNASALFYLTITNNDPEIIIELAESYSDAFTLSVNGPGVDYGIDSWLSPTNCESTVVGATIGLADTITQIDTPVSGLTSVTNPKDAALGRAIETDSAFRTRRLQSLQIPASSVQGAIQSKLLQEVTGVTDVRVYLNDTDSTDGEGRPPHSIAVLIEAPNISSVNQQIVDKIWQYKAAGIQTYGSSSKTVVDSNGDTKTVYYSRPTNQYAWIQVELTLYTEETFPSNGTELAAAAILEYGATLSIGKDLIRDRFKPSIFSAVPQGIKSISVELDITATEGGTPSYSAADVAIAATEKAVFAASRISVSTV